MLRLPNPPPPGKELLPKRKWPQSKSLQPKENLPVKLDSPLFQGGVSAPIIPDCSMNQTLEFLYSLRNQGSKFGIERMQEFCKNCKIPSFLFLQFTWQVPMGRVLSAPCSIPFTVLMDIRWDCSPLPHLIELGERIRVNGKLLSFHQIEEWTDQLMPIFKTMKEKDPKCVRLFLN